MCMLKMDTLQLLLSINVVFFTKGRTALNN